ncbi:hypothetical protein [Streptomyces sp. H39-S7]|uniref:hypothetical protein n=1 Tax=Streptomyces sp. H39-S7 TaxID=3004357 RepID=UPI0022AF9058|nr:hypothetical protein [Streptomyces sp. H39-S7]MCZ4117916.1 hypothetical protein [Streptomyces sp. H39-S7]
MARLAGSDPVGRLLTGVWLAGHVAAAFTLGAVIADRPTAVTAGSPVVSSPDRPADEQTHDL